jgi:hypothetical protein
MANNAKSNRLAHAILRTTVFRDHHLSIHERSLSPDCNVTGETGKVDSAAACEF